MFVELLRRQLERWEKRQRKKVCRLLIFALFQMRTSVCGSGPRGSACSPRPYEYW